MDAMPPEALLEGYPPPIRALAEELRALVRAVAPDAIERVRPGWRLIGYDVHVGPRNRGVFFAFITPEPGHVHVGFAHGTLVADPGGVLLGRGITKRARWLTFRPGDRVDPAIVRLLVRDALRVARRDPRDLRAELALAGEAHD